MSILQATGDIRKVALWLGHASQTTTEVYLQADPTDKLAALDAVVLPSLRRGTFTPPDQLIAMLTGDASRKATQAAPPGGKRSATSRSPATVSPPVGWPGRRGRASRGPR